MIIKDGKYLAIDVVSHDETLNGTGQPESPLSIGEQYITSADLEKLPDYKADIDSLNQQVDTVTNKVNLIDADVSEIYEEVNNLVDKYGTIPEMPTTTGVFVLSAYIENEQLKYKFVPFNQIT